MAASRSTSQRRQQISELVRQNGSVQVTTLAQRFEVSVQTVRKDLRYLAERGITTHHGPEASLNREMAEAARTVVAITDSSKFGKIGLHSIIPISDVDILITDTKVSEEMRQASERLGIELLIA